MVKPKFRIYRAVACLEIESPTGGKWWDQGLSLAYTPYPIAHIQKATFGRLSNSPREVLAAWIPAENSWVALNLPRSDVPALVRAGLWPAPLPYPYDEPPAYAPAPHAL